MYSVFAASPVSVKVGSDSCQSLSLLPPAIQTKRYEIGPLKSVPVVAVIDMAVSLSAAGGMANVAGLGVGGVLSGSVVAVSSSDSTVSLPRLSLILTVYVYDVFGRRPVSV